MDTPLLDNDALTGSEPPQPSTKSQGLTSLKQSTIQATRTDYLQSLLKGSIPDLKLEDGHNTNDDNDNNNTNGPSTPKSGNTSTVSPATADGSTQMNISELREKLASLHDIKSKHNIEQYQEVEVRLKDYSYHVPIRVDAPSIKTVFNQSPCYVGTTILKNVGELITGSRKVSSLHIHCYIVTCVLQRYIHFVLVSNYLLHIPYVMLYQQKVKDILGHHENKYILKDINLVLKPGKTYLVMGPPGCGKTSLLKAVSGMLRNSGVESGRIEYNGVSKEVSNCTYNIQCIYTLDLPPYIRNNRMSLI